jgi:uncharacterized protein (UPF0254 family)
MKEDNERQMIMIILKRGNSTLESTELTSKNRVRASIFGCSVLGITCILKFLFPEKLVDKAYFRRTVWLISAELCSPE